MFQQRSAGLAVGVAMILFAGACGDDTTSPGERRIIANYVASVSANGTAGTIGDGTMPRPTSGGPAISLDGHTTIVNGGTTTVNVTSPTPFQTVYVAGSSPASRIFAPVDGCYEIQLPAPATSAELIITFPQTLGSNEFELHFSVADAQGRVGMPSTEAYDALIVGTGDIQVTVSWDTAADVDLHVIDPAGYEIFWGDRQSPSGGQLDLDSNAGCAQDNVRNENITWPVGAAPQGTYTVRVDYWSSCDAPETDFTVLVHNEGGFDLFHGTFTGPGDGGGYGSGVDITTFTRTTGPLASAVSRSNPVGPTSK